MDVNVMGAGNAISNMTGFLNAIESQFGVADIEAVNVTNSCGVTDLTFAVDDGYAAEIGKSSIPMLDNPNMIDSDLIADFCAKVGDGSYFNLTDGQMAAFCDGVTSQLKALGESAAADATSSISHAKESQAVLFDIYALMALLVDCGQKMRDAARDVRQAENVLVQKTIQNQADMQRTAALTGLVCSVVVCAIQVGMQGVNLVYQGKGFSKQMDAYKKTGHDDVNAPVQDAEYTKGVHMENRARMFGDMIAAIGNVAQGCVSSMSQMISAEATEESAEQQKAQEMLDQAKDLFSQCQNLVDSVIQLMRAVLQAEVQSMRDAIHA